MRTTRLFTLALSAVLLALATSAGCGIEEETLVAVEGDDDDRDDSPASTVPMPTATGQLDVLFVIDNSGSMCEEQAAVMGVADDLVDAITTAGIDARLAVVTTDMVDLDTGTGHFRTTAGTYEAGACALPSVPDTSRCGPVVGPVVQTAGASPLDVAEDLRCLLAAGTDGNFVEMGLEAAVTALETETQARALLRPDTRLAVVFVSDENDCSDGTFGAQVGPVYSSVPTSGDAVCEVERNLEDSCTIALGDTLTLEHDGRWTVSEARGPLLTWSGTARLTREWCNRGVRPEIEGLQGSIELNCPAGGCTNQLTPRAAIRDRLLAIVAGVNGFSAPGDAEHFVEIITVINPDQGVRQSLDDALTPVCGAAGRWGYRYQSFARSFARSQVLPICDPNTGAPATFGPQLVKALVDAVP